MNDGYGQAYQSMYTGSMVGSGAVVFAVWGYVISNTDSRTSMVRLNETVISTIIGESVDVITKAIAVLCAPDHRSHRKAEGGRRLIKQGEWDYFVVNFEHYHGLAKREKRKKYMADLMAKKRAKEKENANIVLTDDNCAMSSLDASLSDLSKKGDSKGGTKRFKPPTPAEVTAYAKTIDFDLDGENFCNFYESKGWKVGNTPMKKWQAAVCTWKKRDQPQKTAKEKREYDEPQHTARIL